MHSAIYTGWVRHRRFAPRPHDFRYELSMFYLDLQELEQVFSSVWYASHRKWSWLEWRRSDYLGDANVPLYDAVKDLIATRLGIKNIGAIRQLTQPRYLGFGFNPVSIYYAFDVVTEQLKAIVAEVSNTPWLEKHVYVMPVPEEGTKRKKFTLKHEKEFHVSPFLPMDMHYVFQMTEPETQLLVHMENWQTNSKVLDATMVLKRESLDRQSLRRVLWRFPLMSWKVVFAIYWQALQLWLKKTPFYSHP